VQRAAGMLGLGTDNVVSIEIDDQFGMRPDALEQAIAQHSCVVCVVASAGSTTTGSVDPLNRIADICHNAGIWLHVDAAYGGAGLLSAELKSLYRGIERADSITMDLHKWFYLAFDGSVLLYRQPQVARKLFYEQSDYVQFPIDGPPEQHMFFHLSPELSRRFRALPTYMMFRHYGADRIGRNIWHNVQCARYLAELVRQDREFELILEPQLSICCFRYAPAGLSVTTVDQMNIEIRDQIEASGDFFMSPTNIHSRPVLRVCIINHATRARHIDDLMCSLREIGRRLHPRELAQ
jgi:glutamate/tyrosine decarboxylase-like PLP-dependent enzyme